MKWWSSSVVAEQCGLCGATIAIGAPLLRLSVAQVRRTRVRCASCAGEPVPEVVPVVGPLEPLTVLRRMGYLPLDEREPGCDG